MTANISIENYAMLGNLQVVDRMTKYNTDNGEQIITAAISLFSNQTFFETSDLILPITASWKFLKSI